MATIDELAGEKETGSPLIEGQEANESTGLTVVEQRRGVDLSFLKAETGEGEIEDYLRHPLNFNRSKGIAQVLRGLTGMFGSLRYAMIDIVMGAMQFSKERKAVAVPPVQNMNIGG